MSEWRLLLTGEHNAFSNMAIDEAVLLSVANGTSPTTVRFYQWSPPAVSIGYFQSMNEEVDVEACKRHGIDMVRRITGGGAVFHDKMKEITYSIVMRESDPMLSKDIRESYGVLCSGIVRGLKRLGIDAEFKAINDICVGGKKISGSAHTRRYGGALQHGTILYDVDLKLMFSLLKVPSEKIRDKLINSASERVTSIRAARNDVDLKDVERAMIYGFEEAFGIRLRPGELSEGEKRDAKRLEKERYERAEWNFKR